METRKATSGDLERMQAIARDTIDLNYRSFIDDDGVDWYLSGPSDEYLARNLGRSTVLTAEGTIIGFAVCRENLIELIMIDHASHQRGFGSALLEHCESKLFERYDAIRLESFEGNQSANRFYRKNGWIQTGSVSDAMSGGRKWIFEKKRNGNIRRKNG